MSYYKCMFMTTSGVLHVYRHNDRGIIDWRYHYNLNGKMKTLCSKSLLKLEQRVKSMRLSWIIKDDDIYEENISRELEEMEDYCILNDIY